MRKYGSATALRMATLYEKACAGRSELGVDVGIGYFPEHDCLRVSGKDRNMPLLTCSWRPASPAWVECFPGEIPSAELPRPACSVHPVTAIRKYGAANTLQTTSYDKAVAGRTKLSVDVGIGCSRAPGCWRACSPARRGKSRAHDATPFFLIIDGLLARCG